MSSHDFFIPKCWFTRHVCIINCIINSHFFLSIEASRSMFVCYYVTIWPAVLEFISMSFWTKCSHIYTTDGIWLKIQPFLVLLQFGVYEGAEVQKDINTGRPGKYFCILLYFCPFVRVKCHYCQSNWIQIIFATTYHVPLSGAKIRKMILS